MKRLAARFTLAAALLSFPFAGVAIAQDYGTQQDNGSRWDNGTQRNDGTQGDNSPQGSDGSQRDNGMWRDHGSQRDRWGWGRDRFQRVDLEGLWVADGRDADFRSGPGDFRGDPGSVRGRGMSRMLLPGVIRIDQRPRMVRVSDARHRTLQEILIDRRFDPRDQGRFDTQNLTGYWRGPTLVVESTGPRGAAITQTFALENRGRTLVVRTKREGWNPGRAVEFTRIYNRA